MSFCIDDLRPKGCIKLSYNFPITMNTFRYDYSDNMERLTFSFRLNEALDKLVKVHKKKGRKLKKKGDVKQVWFLIFTFKQI